MGWEMGPSHRPLLVKLKISSDLMYLLFSYIYLHSRLTIINIIAVYVKPGFFSIELLNGLTVTGIMSLGLRQFLRLGFGMVNI